MSIVDVSGNRIEEPRLRDSTKGNTGTNFKSGTLGAIKETPSGAVTGMQQEDRTEADRQRNRI